RRGGFPLRRGRRDLALPHSRERLLRPAPRAAPSRGGATAVAGRARRIARERERSPPSARARVGPRRSPRARADGISPLRGRRLLAPRGVRDPRRARGDVADAPLSREAAAAEGALGVRRISSG